MTYRIERTCDYCKIEFQPKGQGRPPRFCSKECRQAEFDEKKQGRLGWRAHREWNLQRRRWWRRMDAEMKLNGLDREKAREAAEAAFPDSS